MADLDNMQPFGISNETAPGANLVHLRLKQRNGRKTLTFVENLSPLFDKRKILKAFKKMFSCNGAIMTDENQNHVIQVQGDHRRPIAEFLIKEGIISSNQLRIHGA